SSRLPAPQPAATGSVPLRFAHLPPAARAHVVGPHLTGGADVKPAALPPLVPPGTRLTVRLPPRPRPLASLRPLPGSPCIYATLRPATEPLVADSTGSKDIVDVSLRRSDN
ncbi:hypothetical protein U9M48_032941, partial [Paspalum notatum var. saurae]